MPNYEFECPVCTTTETIWERMGECPTQITCPNCEGDMYRNFGFQSHSPRIWGANPLLSDAAGVHPSQIAEYTEHNKKLGTNVEYTPDGRAIFRDKGQREAHLKANGWFDKN